MTEEIKDYLKHIKDTCYELTEAELAQFSEGITVTELDKNDKNRFRAVCKRLH